MKDKIKADSTKKAEKVQNNPDDLSMRVNRLERLIANICKERGISNKMLLKYGIEPYNITKEDMKKWD